MTTGLFNQENGHKSFIDVLRCIYIGKILLRKRAWYRLWLKWKRINCKQSARWQHLSWLKACAFFSLQKKLVSCVKRNNLYLGLVTPSSGWWSPIGLASLDNVTQIELFLGCVVSPKVANASNSHWCCRWHFWSKSCQFKWTFDGLDSAQQNSDFEICF